mmetsp:Transcript_80354/g.134318  ORF Transcript_80354/g.134318 Transcript_80354/m.134318 type:complete len:89 (-) Transcript_80354:593-859(-)
MHCHHFEHSSGIQAHNMHKYQTLHHHVRLPFGGSNASTMQSSHLKPSMTGCTDCKPGKTVGWWYPGVFACYLLMMQIVKLVAADVYIT